MIHESAFPYYRHYWVLAHQGHYIGSDSLLPRHAWCCQSSDFGVTKRYIFKATPYLWIGAWPSPSIINPQCIQKSNVWILSPTEKIYPLLCPVSQSCIINFKTLINNLQRNHTELEILHTICCLYKEAFSPMRFNLSHLPDFMLKMICDRQIIQIFLSLH